MARLYRQGDTNRALRRSRNRYAVCARKNPMAQVGYEIAEHKRLRTLLTERADPEEIPLLEVLTESG